MLATLARCILAIPATSAPAERLFSQAGITIANDRAGMLPELAESLVFLKCHYKYRERFPPRAHRPALRPQA